MSRTFCALDFETANGSRASVCSVGLVRIDETAGQATDAISGLVTPHRDHSAFLPGNIRVHGITADMVREARAPEWPSVLHQIREFVGTDLVVAHNAPFERSVLRAASAAYGLPDPGFDMVCTVKLSRALLPGLSSHKLPVVAAHLGVLAGNHHDALADARMSGMIAAGLVARAGYGAHLAHLAHAHGQQMPTWRLRGAAA